MIFFLDAAASVISSTVDPANLTITRYDQPLFTQLEQVKAAQNLANRLNVNAFDDYLTKLKTYNTLQLSGRAADTIPPIVAPPKPPYITYDDHPDADGNPIEVDLPWLDGAGYALPDPLVVKTISAGLTGLVSTGKSNG